MMTTTSNISIRKPRYWSTNILSIMVVTTRENEVLKLIAHRNTSQDIAESLFISDHTVLTDRKNLFVTLEASNTALLLMQEV